MSAVEELLKNPFLKKLFRLKKDDTLLLGQNLQLDVQRSKVIEHMDNDIFKRLSILKC